MKRKINGNMYDTSNAAHVGFKFAGEFGQDHGYEEQLYVTKSGQYFIYGAGGPQSPYPDPTIKLLTKEQAEEWEKETPGN